MKILILFFSVNFFFLFLKSITQYFQDAKKGGGENFFSVAGGRVSV